MIPIPKGKQTRDITVTKTISMNLNFLERVLDESEIMQKDFSSTITTLANLGMMVRKDSRIRDEGDAIRAENIVKRGQ